MPKGRVAPREVVCRACGQPFVSDRCGKAAFYCPRPECIAERATRRVVVANHAGAAERRAARAAADAAKAAARRARERERERLAAAREAAKLRARAQRLRPAAVKAATAARERAGVIADLERRADALDPASAPVRPPEPTNDIVLRDERHTDRLRDPSVRAACDAVMDAIARRPPGREPSREQVRRSVVRLAYAEGVRPTADVLLELAAEALAWRSRLLATTPRDLDAALREAAA